MQLQDVRCFLLDMDGTFYLGGQIIPGSLEFIEKVVSSGRDFLEKFLPSVSKVPEWVEIHDFLEA